MSNSEQIQPKGERLRKAIKWISEEQTNNPTKTRIYILREAGMKFDLTPKESVFLEKNFEAS